MRSTATPGRARAAVPAVRARSSGASSRSTRSASGCTSRTRRPASGRSTGSGLEWRPVGPQEHEVVGVADGAEPTLVHQRVVTRAREDAVADIGGPAVAVVLQMVDVAGPQLAAREATLAPVAHD